MLTNIWDKKRGALNPSFLTNILCCSAILYFNDAASLFNEANAMVKPRMSKTESAALEAAESAAKEYLQMALPYLEAAHDALPEDINTIRTLRDIYTRTGQDELREKMNQLLN